MSELGKWFDAQVAAAMGQIVPDPDPARLPPDEWTPVLPRCKALVVGLDRDQAFALMKWLEAARIVATQYGLRYLVTDPFSSRP